MAAASRRAVVAVLLPRDHLPFIREWCEHHIAQGWRVFLYDNTGSTGSARATSAFNPERWAPDPSAPVWTAFEEQSVTLEDEEAQTLFREAVSGLDVTIIPWQPRDDSGRIIHGQAEAYVDFITRARHLVDWGCFIDADEYLHTGHGLSWDDLLSAADRDAASRILLSGERFESRWNAEGEPRKIRKLAWLERQEQGNKNILRIAQAARADVHWGWQLHADDHHAVPDSRQFYFRHYRGPGASRAAPLVTLTVTQRVLRSATDESVAVPLVVDVLAFTPLRTANVSVVDREDGIDVVSHGSERLTRLNAVATLVYELCDGRPVESIAYALESLARLDPVTALAATAEALTELRKAELIL